jgi:hypothetical protein
MHDIFIIETIDYLTNKTPTFFVFKMIVFDQFNDITL